MKHIGKVIKNIVSNRKRMIWVAIAGAALLLVGIGGVEAYHILYTPQDLFKFSTINPTMLVTQNATPVPMLEANGDPATASPTVVPTVKPTPDITESNDIVNVLLIGIDRSQTAGKGSGRDPHADVMMVVAINFKEKKADLISLPRDTFIHAPEIMDGVYKLNASFNVGGGFEAKGGRGFLKVCEAAEYMLGGIPVDYYYAVDFTSLMRVIDTLGGVDYEVENRAYSLQGKKGMQHMSGADVLFYVRSRKVGPEQGDPNRVNRQKKLMIAILQQLTKNGKLSMVPELISTAKNGIYTNTTVDQTLALANFAKNIDTSKIGMHSMTGHYYDKGGWRYCFTQQKERQELIKTIYGIDVPEQVHCSQRYADWLLEYGLDAIRSQKTAKQLLDYADAYKADFTTEQKDAYAALEESCKKMQSSYDRASLSIGGADNREMASDKRKMRTNAEKLAKLLEYKEKLVWTYDHPFWLDPAINAVEVDFR